MIGEEKQKKVLRRILMYCIFKPVNLIYVNKMLHDIKVMNVFRML